MLRSTLFGLAATAAVFIGGLAPAGASTVGAAGSQSPYLGTPTAMPGRVECENFDNGGQSVAYHDLTNQNEGGEYRDTGVDLKPVILGGSYISHTQAGEWVEYTVDVTSAGTYDVRVRVAARKRGGTFHLELGGADITGPMQVPDTGNWQTFVTLERQGVQLEQGRQILRLVMDQAGDEQVWIGNFNWIEIAHPEDAPVGEGLVLEPGDGFDGGPVEPPGSGSQAMAHWDTVPFQTFKSEFNVGAVAFHAHGMDRVEFSVEGGPALAVREMTHNPQTGVVEYWAKLRPEDFAQDGPIEVRAVAYPLKGKPRMLPPLTLNVERFGDLPKVVRYVAPASSGGSDHGGDGSASRPFATIRAAARAIAEASGGLADGGAVYLLPGLHDYGDARAVDTRDRYLTIARAPGTSREEVELTGGGVYTKLVRVRGVTLCGPVATVWTPDDYLWIDDCHIKGGGRTVHTRWAGGWTDYFVTDSRLTDTANGFSKATLQRNIEIDRISSDAFMNPVCVINATVSNHYKDGTSNHPDVVQLATKGSTVENVICYGLVAEDNITSQGLWGQMDVPLEDVAFVNCRLDNRTGRSTGYRVFMFAGPTSHMLIDGCNFIGPASWRDDMGFKAQDVVIRDTHFEDPYGLSELSGVTFDNVTFP